MSPPLTKEHLQILNKEFYENYNFFGRDKLFNMLRNIYGDESPCNLARTDNESMQPSAHRQKEVGAQTKDMAC